jgi:lipopolysaccharide/colanic/teichoic acid biosynthesis glycosyltransferase
VNNRASSSEIYPIFIIKRSRVQKQKILKDLPVATHYSGHMYGWKFGVKRFLDIVISSFLLVILSPIAIIAAIAIKLDSPGHIHFVQERVGLNKRKFRLYKFRTMADGADKKQGDLEDLNEASGPVFKIKNDPRVTPVGKNTAKNQHR